MLVRASIELLLFQAIVLRLCVLIYPHPSQDVSRRSDKKKKIEDGKDPTISWELINKTNSTVNERSGCMLCNLERLAIANVNPDEALNIRNELVTSCRHFKKKFFTKPKKGP